MGSKTNIHILLPNDKLLNFSLVNIPLKRKENTKLTFDLFESFELYLEKEIKNNVSNNISARKIMC